MNTIEKHKTYIEKFQELNGKKQMIQKPEVVMINSNKTDRQYLVRYTAFTKYLEEMITLEHLGQQFTRRALRKWCKKNTITEPEFLSCVQLYLHDHFQSWSYLRDQLRSNLVRYIGNEQTARISAARRRFNIELEHVKMDLDHIYWEEKVLNLKARDKQRFVKALNKLIEDFEPRETWTADHSTARRSKVIERLLDKWQKEKQ